VAPQVSVPDPGVSRAAPDETGVDEG